MNRRIEVFDSLRGIGTVMVFLSHMTFMNTYHPWYGYLENGYFSVAFFFVLSGFVMMLGYHDRFSEKLTWTMEKNFIKKRLRRLYPLYLITMGIFVLYGILGDVMIKGGGIKVLLDYVGNMVLSAGMLQSLVPFYSVARCFNSVAWFLSVIMILYVLTPVLIKLVKKMGGVITVLVSLSGLVVMFTALTRLTEGVPDCSVTHTTPYINVFYYLAGMGIALIYGKLCSNISTMICNVLEVVGVIACIVVNFSYREAWWNPILYRICMVVVLCILILGMAFEKGSLGKLLQRSRILRGLGNISFEVYLIHYPIATIGFGVLDRMIKPSMGVYGGYLILFFIMTIVAAYGYRLLFQKNKAIVS